MRVYVSRYGHGAELVASRKGGPTLAIAIRRSATDVADYPALLAATPKALIRRLYERAIVARRACDSAHDEALRKGRPPPQCARIPDWPLPRNRNR